MQKMAHEWDSFLDNISPLSSDQRTLTQTSEAEHLENLIERGITDIVDSSWQVDEEQMVKDLPSCENGEIPDFATDGLSTSGTFPSLLAGDLQGLKQDCGTLATSLLGDYSNISSCLDADDSETKSSKFMESSLAPKPDIDVVKKLSPEWTCSDAGKMLPTDTLSADLLESNANFPCLLNVCTEDEGSENIVKIPETIVLSYMRHNNISHSSDMEECKTNETEDITNCDGYQDQIQEENVERQLTEKNHQDILVSCHETSTSDSVEVYPEANEEERLSAIASNVETQHNNRQDHPHQDLPKEKITESLNKDNEEFHNLSSISQAITVSDGSQDKSEVKMRTEKLNSLMKNDEQNTSSSNSTVNQDGNLQSSNIVEIHSSTNAFNTQNLELKSSTEISNAPSSTDQQQSSDQGTELRECPEQNNSDNVEFCSSTNDFNTQKLELTSSTEITNAPSSPAQQQSSHQGICEDIDENAEQSLEQNDASTMEQSELGMTYGEPLSGEDTSLDMDETEIDIRKEMEKVHKTDGDDIDHTERPMVQIASSGKLRKHLLPIVLLEPMDSVNGVNNLYDCGNCQHTTHSIDKLLEHHHNNHSMHDLQFCKTCNLYLIGIEQAEKHLCGTINTHPQLPSKQEEKKRKWRGKHKCMKCKLRFIKFFQYVSHMRSHTGTTPYQCNDCGRYFSQTCSLRKHQRVPGRCKKAGHQCNISDANTTKMDKPLQEPVVQKKHTDLRNCYVKLVDISKNHPCTLCCKIFPTAEKANQHFHNVHKGKNSTVQAQIRKYCCPLCPRLFKHSCNMAQHLRICIISAVRDGKGKVNNKYPCPLCHTVFISSSNRVRHAKHGICVKEGLAQPVKERATSQTVDELKKTKDTVEEKHKTVSKEDEQRKATQATSAPNSGPPYPCSLCSAVFQHSSGRSRHMKKHDLFKLTGMFRYRRSNPSTPSKPASIRSSQIEQLDKSSKETGNHSLNCRYCGKCFSSSHSLELHKRCHRGERPYRCLECGKGFKRRTHLTCHKNVHQKKIQCSICKITFPTIGELIEHRKSHPKGPLKCPDCNQLFKFPVYLRRHLETHKNKKNRTSQQSLESMREHSRPLQPWCSLCKKTFEDAQVLRKHCLTHISWSSTNRCPFCKRSFRLRRYLLRHMIMHTAKPLSCANCGKQFFRDLYLKLHSERCFPAQTRSSKRETRPKGLFKCSRCPREFSKKIRHKVHENGHKTNTLIQCSKCGQFFGRTKVGTHKKKCEGTAELNTGTATSVSSSTPQLIQILPKKPQQSNASKKPYFNCPHCTQTFQYRSQFLRHLPKHTGVQPYLCLHCGQGYRSKTKCLQHEVVCDKISKLEESGGRIDVGKSLSIPTFRERVEGKNEYKCKFCTKTFMKPRSLRHHILTHNEVNPYRCKICDSSFSRYDHLKLHQSHCGGKKQRLEVCIPKITFADVGKGWIHRFGTEPSKTQEIECKICSKRFSNQSELSQHTKMFHLTKLYKCMHCSHSFSHESTLKTHIKRRRCRIVSTVRTPSPTPATNLPKENVTQPLPGLRSQILLRIKPCFNKKYKFVCSFCPRTFRKSWQLAVHIRLHTGEKPYVCNHCDERFIRKDYMQRHLLICTKKQQSQQTNCVPKPTSSKAIVGQNHQSPSHSPPKGFSCAYCSSRFLLFSQLQEHFLNAHKLETVVPPVSTVSLQHHLSNIPKIKEEHSDGQKLSDSTKSTCKSDSPLDKGFVCPVCNMSLTNKAGLTGHLRVHAVEHPLNCTICEKGFWNKNIFRSHLRKCRLGQTAERYATQEMEVPLKAQIDFALEDSVFKDAVTKTGVLQTNVSQKDNSSAKFPQDSEENQAQSSSSENKKVVQYQCSECDQTFTDGLMLISHLEDHGRREQEKKLNICTECGKVCSSQRCLEKHMRCHGGSPKLPVICHDSNLPYSCKVCDQRFLSGPYLHEHYIEEHPSEMLKCPFCDKTYATKKSLTRHCKKWHQREQKEIASTLQENRATAQQLNNHSSPADESDEDNDSGGSDSDSAPYFPCHVCGKTFPTSESLEDHQRCHLGEKPHECEECGRCFFQASQLQQHQRMHKSEFQCQACGRGFVSLFALRKHKHTHAKSRPYRCTKCHFSFTGRSHLAEHMKIHSEESFPCDICSRVFSSKSSRAEHWKSHSISGDCAPPRVSMEEDRQSTSSSESLSVLKKECKYRCGICNNCFKDVEELSEHGCVSDKERPYSCQDCEKFFLHTSHLEKHRNTHHVSLSKKEYPCNQCSKNFSSTNHFLSHLKTHVDPSAPIKQSVSCKDGDTFICPVCQKHFTSAIELIGHFPIHLDSTFECKTCKMKFLSQRKLKKHEQRHLTPAVECRKCGQSFVEDEALHLHHCAPKKHGMESKLSNRSAEATLSRYQVAGEEEEIDVTGEDLFNCLHCSRRFSSKSALLDHQNKSHLNKPFKCETCGKSFALRRYLRVHEKRHQSIEPPNKLECSVCQIKFPTSGDLSLHMRVLHAEKEVGQYRCDMCYKSFHHWTLLKRHQESHLGEVVYECTECDKVFAFPHLLEEHRQTHVVSSS